MHSNERLLESEFHVFRISPKTNHSRHTTARNRLSHLIEVGPHNVLIFVRGESLTLIYV